MRISDWSSDVCSSDLVAAFCKVREEHGGLSNMSNDHGYEDQGLKWKSSEAQYQAMRYPGHPEIQEQIRNAPNAFVAKQVAYEHIDKTRTDWKDVDRKSTRLNSSH